MITRLWRGWTAPADAHVYERFLLEELFPAMGGIAGFLGGEVLRREEDGDIAFVVLTRFESLAAVRAFAGEDHERAVLEPRARELLLRGDEQARHFETAVFGASGPSR
jgi:heme-degrading monooxygenase HmoA